jgi:hypothetical protein
MNVKYLLLDIISIHQDLPAKGIMQQILIVSELYKSIQVIAACEMPIGIGRATILAQAQKLLLTTDTKEPAPVELVLDWNLWILFR